MKIKTSQRRRGVAAAELAVCLPVMILLVVGAVETSSMIFLKQSLTVAAFEGGRTAVIPDATADDVEATCRDILTDRRVNGGSIVVGDIEGTAIGDFIRVEVSAPCDQNTIIAGRFFRNRTLTGEATYMKEF